MLTRKIKRGIKLKIVVTLTFFVILLIYVTGITTSSYQLSRDTILSQLDSNIKQKGHIISLLINEERERLKGEIEAAQYEFDLTLYYDEINDDNQVDLSTFMHESSNLDLFILLDNNGNIYYQNQVGIINLEGLVEIIKNDYLTLDKNKYVFDNQSGLLLLIESLELVDLDSGRVKGKVIGGKLINSNISLITRINKEIEASETALFTENNILVSTIRKQDDIDLDLDVNGAKLNESNLLTIDSLVGFVTIVEDDNFLFKAQIKLELDDIVKFKSDSLKQIINSFVIVLVFSLIIYLFMTYLFKSLFKGITTFSREVSNGNLLKRFVASNIVEIDVIGNEIQDMADSMVGVQVDLKREIEVRIEVEKNLKEFNYHLEEIVKSRTEKLEESNVELADSLDELLVVKEELETMNEELEESLKQLVTTQEQLIESEKMAALGNIVVGISHELNTPLGVCLTTSTYTAILIDKLYDIFSQEDTEKYVMEKLKDLKVSNKLIVDSISKMCAIVDEFRTITNSSDDEKIEEIHLNEFLRRSLNHIHASFSITEFEINIECNSNITIKNHPVVLFQLLKHIVTNSVQHGFSNNDGVIQVNVEELEKSIKIYIKDNGKGIPEEEVSKIFDPYYTTNLGKGRSGLGLYSDYYIVRDKLNGSIKCTSVLGIGTTIIIELKR